LLILSTAVSLAGAFNPIVPVGSYFADPEPHVWADGVLYLYCSHDVSPSSWCSDDYHVLSTTDMVHWKDNGVAYSTPGTTLYANDCAYRGGKYYLYYAIPDGRCFVAESASPTGPFANATQIEGVSGIDPAAFVDDDGQAYFYWGQFDNVRCAKLLANMIEIDTSTITQPLSVAKDNFHEGSSMVKRDGVYYYAYADTGRHGGKPTSLGYATAPAPTGPFTYRGVIVDSIGCDPKVWNNHGRIVEFKGKWYVFYHRSSHGGPYLREICVEPISFNSDGSIAEVEMTSQGAGGPIAVSTRIAASRACELSGTVHSEDCSEGGQDLGSISSGDYAAYKYIDFGKGVTTFSARVSSQGTGGTIEIRLGGPLGKLLGRLPVTPTGGWQTWTTLRCKVESTVGLHALYLRVVSPDGIDTHTDIVANKLNIQWFEFGQE
jgi:hypothetical protein